MADATVLSDDFLDEALVRFARGTRLEFARHVEAGSTLADALRRHPRTFDDLFTNLVEVGEAGGILDVVLQRLSAYIEKAAALKRKVKAAMVYPAAIIGVAVMVVIFMLTFVIPTFAQMFQDLGADLPLPTKIESRGSMRAAAASPMRRFSSPCSSARSSTGPSGGTGCPVNPVAVL